MRFVLILFKYDYLVHSEKVIATFILLFTDLIRVFHSMRIFVIPKQFFSLIFTFFNHKFMFF